MKKTLIQYILNLGFVELPAPIDVLTFKHSTDGRTLRLEFIKSLAELLSTECQWSEENVILLLNESALDDSTVEDLVDFAEKLPENISISPLSEESLEQTMKDIWFFLNRQK